MTWEKYLWSVRGGYSEKSRYEAPAYKLQKRIEEDLKNSKSGTDDG
jgi:hypothetical protein